MLAKTTVLTAALAATAVLAVAAGPANAEPKSDDSSQKASCPYTSGTDETKTYYKPHGSTMKIYLGKDANGNSKYQNLKCNDGVWEEVAAIAPIAGRIHRPANGSLKASRR
jgi:hypothetical protein